MYFSNNNMVSTTSDAQPWKPATKLAPINTQPSANAGVTVGRTDWAAKYVLMLNYDKEFNKI